MRQIIKNGTIVTGSGSFPADILIDGEKHWGQTVRPAKGI